MPFDREQIEARLALDLIPSADMPHIAQDALEAGFDGPATLRLAILERPTYFEVAEVLPRVMRELGLAHITIGEAALRVAKKTAREIVRNGDDPLRYVQAFESLWIHSEHAKEIQAIGTLDDEVWVARSMGRSDAEVRDWVMSVLKDFAK